MTLKLSTVAPGLRNGMTDETAQIFFLGWRRVTQLAAALDLQTLLHFHLHRESGSAIRAFLLMHFMHQLSELFSANVDV